MSPSKSKLQSMGIIHNSKLVKIGITLLIILVLALVGGYFVFKRTEMSSVYYTVMLDCGSTGSRVNVYKWLVKDGTRGGENLPVLLRAYPDNSTKSDGCRYHCMQTEPGLDMFVGNASEVRASLEPLIHWAEQWVPVERRGETPIFVLATAGMRRLPLENVEMILADVEDVVKEHGFLYRKSWIRVLTGKEEAYYGWVALNYKMGVLGNASRGPTLGLLDLGGSSLQVVAEVDKPIADEHVLNSKIGSFEHRILTYSLPAFGMNEAFDRTMAILSHTPALRESAAGGFEVRHPCLGSSFSQNYTCRSCFRQRTRDSENSSVVTRNEVKSISLLGDPDWGQCKTLVRAAAINASSLESSRLGDHLSCIGLSSYGGDGMADLARSSHSAIHYHALSGFFAVYNMLNLSSRANVTKMWEKEQQLCSTTWADQTSILRKQYCFGAAYMTSLIEDALCLSNVEVTFGPGDISWTLGAALVEGEYLWRNGIASQIHILPLKFNEMVSSPFLLFAFLLCLLIFVYWSQIKLPMPGRKVSSGRSSLPSYLGSKRPS